MDQTRDDQTGKAGECSCTKEKYHGSTGNLTGGFNTSDAADPHDNGTEYKWKDHHIQGIHVDAAEKTGNCQNRCKTVRKKQSGQDTEKQADKDRTGNMLLIPGIKFFHFSPPQKSGMFGRNPLKHTKYNENYSMHAHLVSRNPTIL